MLRCCLRRQHEIDVNRGGCRCGNDDRLCSREWGLGCGRKGVSLDPLKFPRGRALALDSVTRSENTLTTGSFVFDLVYTVVAADSLGLMNWTREDRSRPAVLSRSS
jgi:hypothetical protein